MLSISSAKAKNEFSSVIKSVEQGEKFIIEYGRKHKKVAMIVPYDESLLEEKPLKPREFGIYKGKFDFQINGDWAMTDEELLGLE